MLEHVPLQTFIDELSFSFNNLQLIVNATAESDSFDFIVCLKSVPSCAVLHCALGRILYLIPYSSKHNL